MRLFLLPANYNGEKYIRLTGSDFNYLVNVLRLKCGSIITGRDVKGKAWEIEITDIQKSWCILSVKETDKVTEHTDTLPQARPLHKIILYQCMPKGRKADDIVRMATEAGVYEVVFVKSKNCVADFSGKEDSKFTRYQAIMREAIQQSGSIVPTNVSGIIDISQIPEHLGNVAAETGKKAIGIVFHQCRLSDTQRSITEILSGFNGVTGLVIGSEGGLTDYECSMLIKSGFESAILNTNILRCETASIYAIAAAQTIIETTCA